MKIKLICVGKSTEQYLIEGENIYLKRLKHYCKLEKIVIPDKMKGKKLSVNEIKTTEGKSILKQIKNDNFIILLDERGVDLTSLKFSTFIESHFINSNKTLTFIIGGAFGFSDEVYNCSHKMIRLSSLTFSHQMVRLFYLEQLYRAMTIIKKENYHNE